jgi:mxaA protein
MTRWALLLLAGAALAAQAETLRVEAGEPRAYGYRVGDVVQRHVTVHAPDGWVLDTTSLPKAGARGQMIELKRLTAAVHGEGSGRRHELSLEYQIFLAPAAVRTLEIPSFRLQFAGARRTEDVLVEAWPLTVAPLVPVEVSPRRGLGDLQPDVAPPLIDTSAWRVRLLAAAALALLLLGALAWIELGPPWRAARNRPFGVAWRQLRGLAANPVREEWRGACRRLHEALNRTAGEVLFEQGLDRFVTAQPRFAGQRDEIGRFLRLSRREFFGDAGDAPRDAAWLRGLCRRLRDAERGRA